MTVILSSNAEAAFLGLALGDAYGRPLEFISGERVRTSKVHIDSNLFMWTDDTHMSLYLADAVLQMSQDTFTEDAFGHLVGDSFSLWFEDPLMPSTAPGNTCLAGVRHYKEINDWRHSGVRTSDGSGSVMRICSLAIAYSGETLDKASEVSSMITHAHPNALAACVAASRILRRALESGFITQAYILEVADEMTTLYPEATDLPKALRAAIEQANIENLEWLNEEAIPAGDGGWRAPSCLGLALTAVLRWGHDFPTAIEKAARINGDSDSVACLAGMFIGAARGLSALPGSWLAALPMREDIRKKAQNLQRITATKVDSIANQLRHLQQLGVHFSILASGHNIRATIPKAISIPAFERVAKRLGLSFNETDSEKSIDIDRSLVPSDILRQTDSFSMPEPRAFVQTQVKWEDITDVEPISNILNSKKEYKTSITDPIHVDWIKSDIGEGKGMIGITYAPGKKVDVLNEDSWERNLEIDLDRLKAYYKTNVLVSLLRDDELNILKIPNLSSEANHRQIALFRSPITNGSVPTLEQTHLISQIALGLCNAGQRVIVHCSCGLGRSGTVVACILTHLGYSSSDAIALSRAKRDGAIKMPEHEKFVHQYASQYS
jgi:ADP-ribosylglycohydrolase